MDTHPLFLNGSWHAGGAPLPVVNPATGAVFAEVSTVLREAVRQAIRDAQAAYAGWRATPAIARGDCLLRIADALRSNFADIAETITLENGKPLAQSEAEVRMSIDHFRWFAEEGRRVYGRWVPNQVEGKRHWVLKAPIGVVGAIAPWNFPLMLASRKVAPALAAGCPVILKPASATPLSALALARCVEASEVPPGVFQVVVGQASEIGAELLENPQCRKLSFTGSTTVGKRLIEGAASTVTRLSLELGGNAPVLVFSDADLEAAVEGVLMIKFRNTGQSCIAGNRIYVERSIYETFLERFIARTRAMRVGNGLEPGVEIGPVIDAAGLDGALRYIEDAQTKGARLCCGGKRWGAQGNFLEPTVLADVPDTATCMHEEVFAPIAPFSAFDTEDEAVVRANATEYGLAAYAYTRDLQRTLRLVESLEAGTIGINDAVPTTSNCPFGGLKQSGWGRELGSEGIEAFLETKHVALGGV
jgi:succinate-semialdehyde dehydrogenase/glutarate-semialdehyde dehydrogenase